MTDIRYIPLLSYDFLDSKTKITSNTIVTPERSRTRHKQSTTDCRL